MNVPLELLPPAAERVAWAVLHSLWQGTLIAFLLAMLLRGCRGRSAALRHALCLGALFVMLAAAITTAVLVSPSKTSRAHRAIASAASAPEITQNVQVPDSPPKFAEAAAVQAVSAALVDTTPSKAAKTWRELLSPLLPWIAGLWTCGVLLMSLRHCGCWLRVRALRRSGGAARSELQRLFDQLVAQFDLRTVRLLESAGSGDPDAHRRPEADDCPPGSRDYRSRFG
jgi:hypothetical protein